MFPGTTTKLSESIGTVVANTINIKTDISIITGPVTINTINPPGMNSGEAIILIAIGGTVTLGIIGNIAVASTISADKALTLFYSKTTKKWYPNQ